MARWLRGDLGRAFESRIVSGVAACEDGLLNPIGLLNLLRQYRDRHPRARFAHARLYNIMVFVEWYEQFKCGGGVCGKC